MMTKGFIFRFLIIMAMIVATVVLYPGLPEIIPIHWNFEGIADDWGSKMWAVWIMPGISILMLFLFPLLAKIDPRTKNYEKFSGVYEFFQTLFILFFAFIFFIQYFMIFYPEKNELMSPIMFSALGILFIFLGNYMGKVRQNYFVGIRTPWTLSDPDVWQKSQRLSGWLFVLGGLVFLLQAWLSLPIFWVFIGVIGILVLIPVIYSYVLYSKRRKQ